MTLVNSKQLLPVYDKPLIYYPLSTMILSGVRELLLITSEEYYAAHFKLLGDGTEFGISIKYAVQEKPGGLPEAFIIGKDFLDTSRGCALGLGDNLLYGTSLGQQLWSGSNSEEAICLGYRVNNPSDFGVVVIDECEKPLKFVEKPKDWVSDLAVPGFYYFPPSVFDLATSLKPSDRGELEITDLLTNYLEVAKLNLKIAPRGTAWFDTGTPDGLLKAAEFVSILQSRQGLLIGSPHEVSWRLDLISNDDLNKTAEKFIKSDYGRRLSELFIH